MSKRMKTVKVLGLIACFFFLSASTVLAQIDFCEGNFDYDQDCDGSDAATFKADFGRSTFNDPCEISNPCNGDFDCDVDVDGTDAALFKSDFGRSPFNNPCPNCLTEPWCINQGQSCHPDHPLPPAWISNITPCQGQVGHSYREPIQIEFAPSVMQYSVNIFTEHGLIVPTELTGTLPSIEVRTAYGQPAIAPGTDHGLGANALYRVVITSEFGEYEFVFRTNTCEEAETNPYVVNNSSELKTLIDTMLVGGVYETDHTTICSSTTVICLLPNDYVIESPLKVPSCVEIIGSGEATSILLNGTYATLGDNAATITNRNDQKADCGIGNSGLGLRSVRVQGACATSCDLNEWPGNSSQHAVSLYRTSNSWVIDCVLEKAVHDGLYIGANRIGPSYKNIIALNGIRQNYRHGIGITAGLDNVIESNRIRDVSYSGIDMENNDPRDYDCSGSSNPDSNALRGNIIQHNVIRSLGYLNGPNAKGIKLQVKNNTELATNVSIIGNSITDVYGHRGIIINWGGSGISSSHLLVHSNHLRNAYIQVDTETCSGTILEDASFKWNVVENEFLELRFKPDQCVEPGGDNCNPPAGCVHMNNVIQENQLRLFDSPTPSGGLNPLKMCCCAQQQPVDNEIHLTTTLEETYCINPDPPFCAVTSCLADITSFDPDNDSISVLDNCPQHYNPDQEDEDLDGIGAACDPCDCSTVNDLDGDGNCESPI